jgi:hypothetical protein
MPTCKLIDNNAKIKIAFYNALLTFGLFLFFGNAAIYNLTSRWFHSYSEGVQGLIIHALLAAAIAGLVTYLGMPSGDHRSCEVK